MTQQPGSGQRRLILCKVSWCSAPGRTWIDTLRREAIVELRVRFTLLSERTACELVGNQRSVHLYRGTRKATDLRLTKRMQELALEYPRFGCRRLGVLLRREGQVLNGKKLHRVSQSAGLALRKLKRKRIHRQPVPLVRLTEPNQEWAMDFDHDTAANELYLGEDGRTQRGVPVERF